MLETSNYKTSKSRLLIPESEESELANASHLLKFNEESIPEPVREVITHCVNKRVGFILSRNAYAGNCRDARNKRYRLGHTGIPLYDELKSYVGFSKDYNSNDIIVAMHCRGHMTIDLSKVQKIMKFTKTIEMLPENHLKNLFSMNFGSVNPILLDLHSNQTILQVFDEGILKPVAKYPGTMMTNAGEHTWGIEFDPEGLSSSIRNKIVDKIAFPDTELKEYELPRRLNPKSIGIITGNGPDSGIALWQDINENIVSILGDHFLGDISLPKVTVLSVPALGLSMELDQREEATWEALSEAVLTLKNLGVDLLGLACHTTHYFTHRIKELFNGDGQYFISMPDIVINHIVDNKLEDFAILGISCVSDLDRWSAYSSLRNFSIEDLDYSTKKRFLDLGYFVKKKEKLHQGYQELNRLINEKIKSKNVIIALTELSILLQSFRKTSRKSQRNIIDALELYAQAIAEESIGLNNL
jgi:aspartate/glutamate racemase/prolyl-tRNA editing enzyme YbaK/EbsC (Cys-tRNA(Pro) deacylase)